VPEGNDDIESLLAQSEALVAVKRFATAAERASDAARKDPDNPRAYWVWARALHGDGRFADAARMADDSIRLSPESAQGYRLRSVALSTLARSLPKGERGKLGEEALGSARQAVRLAPHDANSHLALAGALTLTGQIAEADRTMEDVFRLAPNSVATWVTASVVAISAKNWDAAISASRRALEIDPGNYAALNNLGVALRAGGRGREGTRVLAEAARANPDGILARQNLSRAGLRIVRVAILILFLPLLFLTRFGILGFLVLSIGSNIVISRNPALALRLERVGAPVALLFAGKPRDDAVPASTGRRGLRRRAGTQPDAAWSATADHPSHSLGNPVLVFGAIAAWAVALVLVVEQFRPDPHRVALTLGFVVFAALGAWAAWVVQRRRKQDKLWADELGAVQRSTSG
jgi:Flp pilus assembly protein TadD